jgi:hypothetical protein
MDVLSNKYEIEKYACLFLMIIYLKLLQQLDEDDDQKIKDDQGNQYL